MNTINLVKKIRYEIINMSYRSKAPHLASSLSCADIITVLYEKILKINKKNMNISDKFILSKGHAATSLYAILSYKKYFNKKKLMNYAKAGSLLEEHPNPKINGVEAPTGSLGHGLPIGCGMALAAKIKKQFPERQIVIGIAEKNHAFHSPIYENNPNIADCRNLDNDKPIHLIDYHELNRPYIDYDKSIPNNYVWRNFKPIPGEIYFSDQEIIEAKKIISDAKKFWDDNHNKKFRNIIFLETSSTKI